MNRPKSAPCEVMMTQPDVSDTGMSVDPEAVWSKSGIARRKMRCKIAEARAVKRKNVLLRRLANGAAQAAMHSTIDRETSIELLQRSKQTRSNRINDVITVAPCVSKCLSSATRAAETFEVRALQRHRNLHRQKTLSKFVDMSNKKQRGHGSNAVLVLCREIDCVECIMLRETHLGTTRNMVQKLDDYYVELGRIQETVYGGESDGASSTASLFDDVVEQRLWRLVQCCMNELGVLIDQLRLISLDIVERATAWRDTRKLCIERVAKGGGHACGLEHLIGLTYHGENYLIKMMSDLAFLDKSPAAKHYLDGASCMENPFVLPINDRLLEARCLDAVKRMQVEVRCATLSVRAQISPLHGTLRSNQSATMPDLRKWDPAALMNRLHLIPTHTKIGATALDRGLFTEGEPSINGAGTKFSRMGGRYASHLPRSFHSQNSDKPIVSENSSSASQVPEYMFLRRMLKGRIEPKQHVKLKPVVGLPGNPVCGVPISRSPPSAREEFTFDAFKDAAASTIQCAVRGVQCRKYTPLTQRNFASDDTIEDSPTAIIQACNNDQRKARLICEFVGTTTDKQGSLRLSKSLSNEATPRKIYSTDRTSARDLHTNPSTEAKPPEYVNHSAVSDELARERGAKRIQDLIRSLIGRRVSFNVHETKRTRTVDDAMTLFQAHMRGIASRNTSFRDLVAANAGRRRTRVDEAVATALERAIMDEEWDG